MFRNAYADFNLDKSLIFIAIVFTLSNGMKSLHTNCAAGIISKGTAFEIIFHNKSIISSLKIEKFQVGQNKSSETGYLPSF
ncbi:hypothetical protein [Selenomonas sp. KH1T6]|uniref:hypothetical protein n=1 Tax=Selenomonas sp. KH1T6 TaxID=3158784 RepID=UPI0011149883